MTTYIPKTKIVVNYRNRTEISWFIRIYHDYCKSSHPHTSLDKYMWHVYGVVTDSHFIRLGYPSNDLTFTLYFKSEQDKIAFLLKVS